MKRIPILFCVLALLLTACTPAPAPETTPAPITTDPAQTAAPSGPPTEPAQTEPFATEPPMTEPPVTEPGYQAGGSPTAGGVVVYTDPSAYKPYSGSEAKYTRLREGPLDHFEPSKDYGTVYPYAAARFFNSLEDGQSWEAGARYGLVDASGRILTDGIYSNVKPMTDYDYKRQETIYLPYWILETVDRVEIVTEGVDGETYSYIDGDVRYGVVSMDGSFMLPMEYRGISTIGIGFRCTREWDGVSYEFYDESGRLLFTGADLIGGDDFTGVTAIDGGEGFFLVELYGDERDTQCWFCNSRGERILGPYAEAEAFHDGLACVSLDGEWYGYIDAAGAWIIDPQFTNLGSFQDGRAMHRLGDESYVVIDTAGNVVFSLRSDIWLYDVPCGYRADSGDRNVRYYDRDGNFLLSGTYRAECLDEDTFWEWGEDGDGRIFRLNGSELSYAGFSLSPGMTVLDGKAVAGYLGYGYDEEAYHNYFIPNDLSAVLEIGGQGQNTPGVYNTAFVTVDQCTNETWYLSWNGTAWDAVSESGEVHTISLRASTLSLRGERIMAVTERACVYVDWDGKLLFSYPLDGGD